MPPTPRRPACLRPRPSSRPTRRHPAPTAEPLEGRVVLTVMVAQPAAAVAVAPATVTIGGTAAAGSLVSLFDDANGNGDLDRGEAIVGGQELAPRATAFKVAVPLVAGATNHFLAEAMAPGPGRRAQTVVPSITEDSAVPFIASPTAPVTMGSAFPVISASITGSAEAGSLIRVYRDDDGDGKPDSTTPDFEQQLPAGATDFRLTPALPRSANTRFLITETDAAGHESATAAVPIITTTGPVGGKVFLDRNGDGLQEEGEPGLPGRVVYLDANNSGMLDDSEKTATTDAQGEFVFFGTADGSATVREEVTADSSSRYVVDQSGPLPFTFPQTISVAVTPFSPVAPVPIVPNPISAGGTGDANYVRALYETVLGREPGVGEVGGWLAAMAGGMSTDEVALRFVNSPEHRTFQVASYYRNFLHRDVDPLAQGWVADLESGALTDQQVVKGILDSDEYYQQAHNDLDAYVRGLYLDVLGRVAGDSEVASQLSELPIEQFSLIANRIVDTEEVNDQIVDSFYANFLRRDRQPDSSSAFWVDRLAQGASASAVEVGILSSAEFLAYARSNKAPGFMPG